jgi:hypothetical protein
MQSGISITSVVLGMETSGVPRKHKPIRSWEFCKWLGAADGRFKARRFQTAEDSNGSAVTVRALDLQSFDHLSAPNVDGSD